MLITTVSADSQLSAVCYAREVGLLFRNPAWGPMEMSPDRLTTWTTYADPDGTPVRKDVEICAYGLLYTEIRGD